MNNPDIRTVETIEVNDKYRVRVAKAGPVFEAAVVESRKSPLTLTLTPFRNQNEDDDWRSRDNAPRARNELKYVAVGMAIEQYLESFEDDNDE